VGVDLGDGKGHIVEAIRFDAFAVNNRITRAGVGIEFALLDKSGLPTKSATGFFRDNLTFGVTTPYLNYGGFDAGNNH